jgi:hypothetical protein
MTNIVSLRRKMIRRHALHPRLRLPTLCARSSSQPAAVARAVGAADGRHGSRRSWPSCAAEHDARRAPPRLPLPRDAGAVCTTIGVLGFLKRPSDAYVKKNELFVVITGAQGPVDDSRAPPSPCGASGGYICCGQRYRASKSRIARASYWHILTYPFWNKIPLVCAMARTLF